MAFLKDTVTPRRTEGNYSVGSENESEMGTRTEFNESQTQDDDPEQPTQEEAVPYMPDSNQLSQGAEDSLLEVEHSTPQIYQPIQAPDEVYQETPQYQGQTHATQVQTNQAQKQTQPSMHPVPATPASSSQKKKRKREPETTPFEKAMLSIVSIEEKKIAALNNNIDDDADMLFLKSLHPFFKELNSHQNLMVRNMMQNVLAEAILSNSAALSYTPSPQPVSHSSASFHSELSYTNLN